MLSGPDPVRLDTILTAAPAASTIFLGGAATPAAVRPPISARLDKAYRERGADFGRWPMRFDDTMLWRERATGAGGGFACAGSGAGGCGARSNRDAFSCL